MFQRRKVALCEIRNVDVVPDGRPVFRVVVVAKNREVGTTADGDLREEGEEIVGDAERVFAQSARDVGTGGVKVAQGGGFPGGVCDAKVFDEVFAGDFGAAVGVCGTAGTDFYEVSCERIKESGNQGWESCRGNVLRRRILLQRMRIPKS